MEWPSVNTVRARLARSACGIVLALVAAGTACGGGSGTPPGPSAGLSGPPPTGPGRPGGVTLPATGALFGVWTTSRIGHTTRENRMLGFESLVGHPMALERVYYDWFEPFPSYWDKLAKRDGRTLILSWSAKNGDAPPVPWAAIASGTYDALIDARAVAIEAFGAPLFFVFQHEPNGKFKAGTAREFVAAYRHIHDRFILDGVTNVSFGFVMFDTAFERGTVDDYYPGDEYVDVVGADVYNWYGCPGKGDPWRTFADKAGPFHRFLLAHGKPGFVPEWGSNEDLAVPGRKARWIRDAAATIESWPDVKAVAYFDARHDRLTCNWMVDTSPSALAAVRAMVADPYFNPPPDG